MTANITFFGKYIMQKRVINSLYLRKNNKKITNMENIENNETQPVATSPIEAAPEKKSEEAPKPTKDENKSSKAGMIILVILLLASWGMIGWLYVDSTKKIEEKEIVIVQMSNEKTQMLQELDSIQKNLESLRSDNEGINAELEERIAEVKKLKNQVWSAKNANKKEIEGLKEQIATMQSVAQEYVQKLAMLNQENAVLRDSTRTLLDSIIIAQQKEVEQTQQISELTDKVDKASALKAQAVLAVPIDKKSKPNFKTKKVVKLKVSGIILENPIAEAGSKTIYVRIVRNDGVVLAKSQSNTFTFDGEEILYSEKRDITYSNKDTDFEVYYDIDENVTKGSYKVTVFCNDKEVGTASFVLI